MRSFVEEIEKANVQELIAKMNEAEKLHETNIKTENKDKNQLYDCDPESNIFERTSVFRKLVQGKARFSPLAPYEDVIELCAYRLSNNNAPKKPRANSKNSLGIDLKI
jgi:hypothetical protein